MDTPATGAQQTDLHRLELRFAQARLAQPQAIERLARSIEQCGQLVACIAVVESASAPWVLVDGYRRVAALRRLGRDTACVEPWTGEVSEALFAVLARAAARPFAAIEEALLLRELVQRYGISERELARRSGRDVSWVSRRLQLVCALPEPLLQAVRAGTVSSWAATRVLAPLARANTEHATRLLAALPQAALSTRELRAWFEQYQKATRLTRERLLEHPRLFVQALRAQQAERAIVQLRVGPEGEFARDCRRLLALLGRLRLQLHSLGAGVAAEIRAESLAQLCQALEGLRTQIQRSLDYDPGGNPPQRAHAACAGAAPAHDQPAAQALA